VKSNGDMHYYTSLVVAVLCPLKEVPLVDCDRRCHSIPEQLVEGTSATYETVSYIIRVKRSSTFYVVMIVLPSFILTFLCVLGLFWTKFDKTDYLEKLALGFAAILAMCTVLAIAEAISTEELPVQLPARACNHISSH
ncbi:hypothetical protein OSTOST_14586, partial [Ostertagia ostertagi]